MKSKLNKQQKKYIKACDSKELRKELKRFFRKENKYGKIKYEFVQSTTGKIGFPSETTNDNSLTKETLESLTNPDLIEKKKSLEDSIEQHIEEQEILKLSESYKGPMEFCVEITYDNKEVLEKIWKDFHNDRVGYLDNNFLHSNSLHTYCYSSNVSEDNSKPIQVVSTEEFLRYIGKEELIDNGEKFEMYKRGEYSENNTLEFDLPKTPHKDKKGNLFLDSGIFQSETFNDEVTKISKFYNDKILEELINYTPPAPNKVKKYTVEDMEKCFNESRLTHPVIGFKHTNFAEYLKLLKNEL